MTGEKAGHIVVVPFQAWGHLRPILHLSVQLLEFHHNLHVTLLLTPESSKRVQKELKSSIFNHLKRDAAEIGQGPKAVLDRLQTINVSLPDAQRAGLNSADFDKVGMEFGQAAPAYIAALMGGDQAALQGTENKFNGFPVTCIIFDAFQFYIPDAVAGVCQSLGKEVVPLIAFLPGGATVSVGHFAKELDQGFIFYVADEIKKAQEEGKDPVARAAEIGFGDHGHIRKLPGLPEMTDFELHPGYGTVPMPGQVIMGITGLKDSAWSPYTKALIGPAFPEMEPEALEFYQKMLGKPFIDVGLQYPKEIWEGKVEPPRADDVDAIKTMEFLDEMYKKHGKNSLLYFSFGSAFFPIARVDLVEQILLSLIKAKFPFLFAYATELFNVPPTLLDAIKDYPDGHAVHVAPQLNVLHHDVTGFFLSHCGANSTSEAITAGVPIIGMPFAADQGEHVQLLKKFGAGDDIKQVKVFYGPKDKMPKKTWDGVELIQTPEAIDAELSQLWTDLKGSKGDNLRKGMAELKKRAFKSKEEGGARKNMQELSRFF